MPRWRRRRLGKRAWYVTVVACGDALSEPLALGKEDSVVKA